MNAITSIHDMINHVPTVRIIKQWDPRYWEEFDIASNSYKDKIVLIQRLWWFSIYNYADVQFLTPVKYKWRYIWLWDKINRSEVFDYCWHDDKWNVRYAISWNYTDIDIWSEMQVQSKLFDPLYNFWPKIELTSQEMIDELKRRWVCLQDATIEVWAPTSYIPTSGSTSPPKSHLSNIIFMNDWNTFSAYNNACSWLLKNWYSYWSLQWSAKVWFKKWKVHIGKWRNLLQIEIQDLDGYIRNIGWFRDGGAEIVFYKK